MTEEVKTMTQKERIAQRDVVHNELQHLKFEKQKLEAKIKTKQKELEKVCPCNEREGYGIAICVHCGETH